MIIIKVGANGHSTPGHDIVVPAKSFFFNVSTKVILILIGFLHTLMTSSKFSFIIPFTVKFL